MTQIYFDPEREEEETALPDCEVFFIEENTPSIDGESVMEVGWYWWPCFPGCLPDGDPVGPFETEEEAIKDAQNF